MVFIQQTINNIRDIYRINMYILIETFEFLTFINAVACPLANGLWLLPFSFSTSQSPSATFLLTFVDTIIFLNS